MPVLARVPRVWPFPYHILREISQTEKWKRLEGMSLTAPIGLRQNLLSFTFDERWIGDWLRVGGWIWISEMGSMDGRSVLIVDSILVGWKVSPFWNYLLSIQSIFAWDEGGEGITFVWDLGYVGFSLIFAGSLNVSMRGQILRQLFYSSFSY